ncbi:MAG: LON peptidase substrate-binding domain-containing protein [Acidobacteria bacterium]|nr:LON peptidase substrate-binding domain-containing protein [Acidobacteriota bacterium]
MRTAICAALVTLLVCAPATPRAQTAAAQPAAPAPGGLPAVIPIFPLESATLFPNGSYPLHIFEPRYRAMVADALKGDRIIGMVMLQPGHEAEYEGRPPIFPVGCAGLITEYEELPDGRYNIVLGGLVKFRVTGEDNNRPYRLARVVAIPEPLDDRKTAALTEGRKRLEALLDALSDRLPVGQPLPGMPDETLVDLLSQYLPMERLARQRLLELEDPLARAGAIVELLEAMVTR